MKTMKKKLRSDISAPKFHRLHLSMRRSLLVISLLLLWSSRLSLRPLEIKGFHYVP